METLVCNPDQIAVKLGLICARLVAGGQQDRVGPGSKANATRHTPPAPRRISFIFEKVKPFSVSISG